MYVCPVPPRPTQPATISTHMIDSMHSKQTVSILRIVTSYSFTFTQCTFAEFRHQHIKPACSDFKTATH